LHQKAPFIQRAQQAAPLQTPSLAGEWVSCVTSSFSFPAATIQTSAEGARQGPRRRGGGAELHGFWRLEASPPAATIQATAEGGYATWIPPSEESALNRAVCIRRRLSYRGRSKRRPYRPRLWQMNAPLALSLHLPFGRPCRCGLWQMNAPLASSLHVPFLRAQCGTAALGCEPFLHLPFRLEL